MLWTMIGLPAAACRRRPAPVVEWPGGFVGKTMPEVGHKLREGFDPAPTRSAEVKVLILGAGVAGLTAGRALVATGVGDLAVLELGPVVGGTSVSGRSGDVAYPWGAHYLPVPSASNPDLLELLAETGSLTGRADDGTPIFEETHLCASPSERVYYRGFWYEGLYPTAGASDADRSQRAAFDRAVAKHVGMRGSDGKRAFTLPIASCSADPKTRRLDRMSMAEWLDRNQLDSKRLRWWIDYACRDDFGTELADVSAWAAHFYFAARVESPGAESAEFLTWPQGNGFLVDHLAAKVGAERIHTGTLVTSVRPTEDGRRVDVRSYDTKTHAVTRWIAERVIFALPSFLRRPLLRGFDGLDLDAPSYAPWLVANIHLARMPADRGFPVAWDNVIYGSRSLGYVVATHQQHRTAGPTVWTYYLPMSGGDPAEQRQALLSLDYQQACDAIVTDLERCHQGLRALIRKIDIRRWGHPMVRPTVGLISDRRAASKAIGPLHFAHTDLSGMALFEEAFFHGNRAAREVSMGLSR